MQDSKDTICAVIFITRVAQIEKKNVFFKCDYIKITNEP